MTSSDNINFPLTLDGSNQLFTAPSDSYFHNLWIPKFPATNTGTNGHMSELT